VRKRLEELRVQLDAAWEELQALRPPQPVSRRLTFAPAAPSAEAGGGQAGHSSQAGPAAGARGGKSNPSRQAATQPQE